MKLNRLLFALAISVIQTSGFLAKASGLPPQVIYESLPGELNVQLTSESGPLVGISITQRNNSDLSPAFCRRFGAVVPHPRYSYQCFYPTLTGKDAEALYSRTDATELHATFRAVPSGSVLVGSSWKEKHPGLPQAEICVETAPVVPHPIASYTCYANGGGVGGGVSGGN